MMAMDEDFQRDDLLILVHGGSLVRLHERSAKRLLVIETVKVAHIRATVDVAEGAHGPATTNRAWEMRLL